MGKQPVNVQTASSRAVVSTAQPAVPTDAAGALGTRQVSAVPWEADVEGRQEGQAGVPELGHCHLRVLWKMDLIYKLKQSHISFYPCLSS